ncbi:hypothetical protein [Zhihengliuella halotolerans]|uniref:Uncharacterized protein n=1 Tax=Zhihengliuella halotolerans TaxID=370736 RepID=A0A4Q8AGF8_9MICC|nr:hypothetical protein [Zhihengliuella halotolerans]RZU62835.1 hypothetical protein EV380_2440 [Zhihengliuella halotolerans]
MGKDSYEDERYKKYYNNPPHGEVPQDPKRRDALVKGTELDEDVEPERDPEK